MNNNNDFNRHSPAGHANSNGASTASKNGSPGPAENVQRSVSGLAHGVTELVEMQGRLLIKDLDALWSTSKTSAAMLIAGVVLAFSSAPLFLLGIGWAVAESTGMPRSVAFIGTAVLIGVLPAGGLIWFAVRRLQTDACVLQRSGRELTRNLNWFKDTMKRRARAQGTPAGASGQH